MGKAAGHSIARSRRHRCDGAASLVVAVSLVLLAGLSALAVDYAYLHHRKAALHQAAETGALAGAAMLVRCGRDMAAVRDATVKAAQKVLRGEDSPSLAVRDSDVVFLKNGVPDAATPDQVQVTAGRTDDRGNPVRLFLGGLLGQRHVEVSTRARAGLSCSEASEDLFPMILPAGYSFDDGCDVEPGSGGDGILNAASSCEMASVLVSGYGERDVGRRMVLFPGRIGEVSPAGWYPVMGDARESGDAGHAPSGKARMGYRAALGDRVTLGGVADEAFLCGQARQRMDEDPDAYWDDAVLAVRGSRRQSPEDSPRLARVAFFDPSRPPAPGRQEAHICQFGAVFIEEVFADGRVGVRLARALAVGPHRAAAPCDPGGVGLYGVGLEPVPGNGEPD